MSRVRMFEALGRPSGESGDNRLALDAQSSSFTKFVAEWDHSLAGIVLSMLPPLFCTFIRRMVIGEIAHFISMQNGDLLWIYISLHTTHAEYGGCLHVWWKRDPKI